MLFTLESGTTGRRVLFLHGLFGQGRNWNQIGKALSPDHRVTLVDLPNHGRSDWTDHFSYLDMADQVAELIDAADPAAVVGHSMGGKVAMALALRHPDLVERLCVVDMTPLDYGRATEFTRYIEAMRAIDLTTLASRDEAEVAMSAAAPDPGVRAFLLQNLRREGEGWRWQANLDLLGDELAVLTGWPTQELAEAAPFTGLTLLVGGEDSAYVDDDGAAAMARCFPRVRRVTVKGAGHWVHSQQPQVMIDILRRFVA